MFRDMTGSFKRPRTDNEVPFPSKCKNTERKFVTGSRTRENSRKMKSPLWIYLCMEYHKDTNKAYVVEDLG